MRTYCGIVMMVVGVLLGFMPQTLLAQAAYTVAPLVIDESVEARDIISKEITLTNAGSQPVTVYPSVNNISLSEGGTIQEFTQRVESDATASLAAWIEIRRGGIKLMPGEQKKIPLTIRVHPQPQEGVYHAFVGFGHGRTADDAAKMVMNGQAPGTIVTVSFTENKSELIRLSRFIIDRFITSPDNTSITYVVNNPGETSVTPSGEIIFYNNRGEEVGSTRVNPDSDEIAPGGEIRFTTAAPVKGLLGKYKAYLSVEYGSSQLASVQDTAFFYVFPMKTLLILFGVLLVLTAAVALWAHHRFLDEEVVPQDADRVHLHIREGRSEPKDHDIHLGKKDS